MATRTQRARQIASYVGAGIIPGQGGGAPSGYAYALDNDNSIAVDADGARGMEAA
ncbi:hypothetical protein [Rhizobium sp. Leaf383]|uniref:hypothetical protein n=1 Tax=Rhizobium sp. Leaf383 TaxID=1736357 RepID=UPI000B0EEA7A|nr:hypothetical protein [Rhizobium sp. Leaf383]